MILTKLGQHVNEVMAVSVKKIQNFWWSSFLLIKQNVNMATSAILHFGLTMFPVCTMVFSNSSASVLRPSI